MDNQTDSREGESQGENPLAQGLSPHRVEALADGVFAIAMTLLVFNVHLPDLSKVDKQNLGTVILGIFVSNGQGSVLVAYILSFALLGVHWVSHHAHFQYIRHVNRALLWINILFFALIAFVPFTTQLVGALKYSGPGASDPVVIQTVLIIYGVHLMCIAAVTLLHWRYGTSHPALTNGALDTHIIRIVTRRILTMLLFALIAMIVSYFYAIIGLICYLLIPVYYILPGNIDLHWRESSRSRRKRSLP